MKTHFRNEHKFNLLASDLYTRKWKFYDDKIYPFKKNINSLFSKTRPLKTDLRSANKSIIEESKYSHLFTEGHKEKSVNPKKGKVEEAIKAVFERINQKAVNYNPEDVEFSFIKRKLLRKQSIPESTGRQKSILYKRLKEKKDSDILNEERYEFALPHMQENDNAFKGRYVRLINKKTTIEHLPIIKPILKLNTRKEYTIKTDFGTYDTPLRKRNSEANPNKVANFSPNEQLKLTNLCKDISNILKNKKQIPQF